VSAVSETVVRRTIQIAELPAPTGREQARAELVRSWWESDGLDDVRTDHVGNVWGRVREGTGSVVIVCAHLDTVFGDDVAHTVRVQGDTLVGPSVGDDSVGLAALSAVGPVLPAGRIGVWVLATVGEEGLGNLAGVNAALDHAPGSVAALIAVEGNYLGRVSTVGVGSVRRRVLLRGPGGHAWESADAPSAIHELSRLVTSIVDLDRPSGTTLNVGRLGGGEGINMRAREAWCELDLRGDDPERLASLAREVNAYVAGVGPGFIVEQEDLGDRPAGRIDAEHPLVLAAQQALGELGTPAVSPPTSTDANAAHVRGVPAIAVGITTGSGEHTTSEWIDTGPIDGGVRTLARTIELFEELSA
jgi:acetylornithine deacetylase/succinyl-diaminopimelate desuccinylase-like protein